jgi:hypothetical protein
MKGSCRGRITAPLSEGHLARDFEWADDIYRIQLVMERYCGAMVSAEQALNQQFITPMRRAYVLQNMLRLLAFAAWLTAIPFPAGDGW